MRNVVVPVMLIAAGLIWLLFNLDWIPSFDWVVTLVLVGAGILVLALDGFTKKSVMGGFLLIALGVTWLLHFHFGMRWRFLAPGFSIFAGCLMLVARMSAIPDARRQEADAERAPR